jgi:hypothetical protein
VYMQTAFWGGFPYFAVGYSNEKIKYPSVAFGNFHTLSTADLMLAQNWHLQFIRDTSVLGFKETKTYRRVLLLLDTRSYELLLILND